MGKKITVVDTLRFQPFAGGVVQYTENIIRAMNEFTGSSVNVESIPYFRPFILKGDKYIGVRRVIYDLFIKLFYGSFGEENFFVCTNYIIPFFLSKKEKLNTLVVVHDLQHIFFPNNFSTIKLKWLNYSLRRVRKHTGKVVFISESTKNDFINKFGAPENYKVIHNPIYLMKDEIFAKKSGGYLLCASNYYPHKNFFSVMELFCEMCERGYMGDLYVTGHGGDIMLGEFIKYNKKIKKHKSRIKFLGFLSRVKLLSTMYNCDALISLSRFEGFNMPAAEAAIMGVKLILSNIPVHRELYGDYATFVECDLINEDVDKCLEYINNDGGSRTWDGRYLCSPNYVAKNFLELM